MTATITKTRRRFTERTVGTVKVDREAGVLRGVKVLGLRSKNGRRYLPEALRAAVSLYEGCRVYADHPKQTELESDRSVDRLIGSLRSIRYVEGKGLFGDLHLLRSTPFFERVIELASREPHLCGLSHVADGDSYSDRGEEVVESIKEVFSVDLVTNPATVAGLFESVATSPDAESHYNGPAEADINQLAGLAVRLVDAVESAIGEAHATGSSVPLADEISTLADLIDMFEQWLRRPEHDAVFGYADDAIDALRGIQETLVSILSHPANDDAPEAATATLANLLRIVNHVAAGESLAGPADDDDSPEEQRMESHREYRERHGLSGNYQESFNRAAGRARAALRRW